MAIKQNQFKPIKIRDIAQAQKISVRFMEIILNELKHGGFIEATRGRDGGYVLSRNAENITIGEIIEYIQGPISVLPETDTVNHKDAFTEIWLELNNAIAAICNSKTFAEAAQTEMNLRKNYAPDYVI